jgi:class 3 adenylate cyclase
MMHRLGDEKGRGVLREHEQVTRNTLKTYGGSEIKTMGDGFMAGFTSITKAVESPSSYSAPSPRETHPLVLRLSKDCLSV